MNILVLVAANPGENPGRRKGQGFRAMLVSPELGGPKAGGNASLPKGKPVNIPAPER